MSREPPKRAAEASRVPASERLGKERDLPDAVAVLVRGLAHDLKEPLNLIAGDIELALSLLPDSVDAETRQLLADALDAAHRLVGVTDDVLAGPEAPGDPSVRLTVHAAGVPLSRIADDAVANLRHRIRARNARIQVGHLPSAPVDPFAMTRVLQNLIGNALKHSTHAAPRIDITCDDGGDEWLIHVADDGPGFDVDDLPRLLRAHERGDTDAPGVGLGLAVCHDLVVAHGGRLWADAARGRGATFHIALPKSAPADL